MEKYFLDLGVNYITNFKITNMPRKSSYNCLTKNKNDGLLEKFKLLYTKIMNN